jgi:hypothetical protein
METVIKRNLLGIYTVFKNAHSAIELATNGLSCTRHSPSEGVGYYKFAVVRHPLDRLVSNWSFFTKRPVKESYRNLGVYQGMEFEEFVDVISSDPSVNPHFDFQIGFLGGQEMDEVCPMERLNERWKTLSQEFNLNPLPDKYNSSKRGNWEQYYSNNLKQNTLKVFKEDLDLYNYSLKGGI